MTPEASSAHAAGEAPADVIVVGAGIAGAVAARRLHDAGARVLVLDKARGVGGRMATRRLGEATLDHGAQFFTAPGELLTAMVDDWQRAGVVVPWFEGRLLPTGGRAADGHPRWRGRDGMTSVAKHLLDPVAVRTSARVTALRVIEANGIQAWSVETEDGLAARARQVVLTPPVPQTLAVLQAGGVVLHAADADVLGEAAYHPCLALLAVLDGPSGLPAPGILRPAGEPIEVVTDNQLKGISRVPALTVHAGPHASAELWDAPDDVVVSTLLGALPRLIAEPRPEAVQVQRWRYARPVAVVPEPFRVLRDLPPAVLAGDIFDGPLVGGAARSGWVAAGVLLGD
ncbi:NAD(P)/FAD-dependent oxidoreductase [Rhabdothermincola salaria]|uniref:NAD(P)/FAD-dependent oxidoreductase n=1 Tax=Rhabdothermincola salaria TaxID=2903142 RepID=UPI001E629F46|nr:FAD-dependent oxidoreductase [Rhabdothermincola salaria]